MESFVICYITLLNLLGLAVVPFLCRVHDQRPFVTYIRLYSVNEVLSPSEHLKCCINVTQNVNGFRCCALHIPELSKTNSFLVSNQIQMLPYVLVLKIYF